MRADVHTATFGCADCHGDRNDDPMVVDANDVHGNGTEYDTLLRPGAIAARCEDCHTGADAPMATGYHSFGDTGNHNDVDCSTCHMETVISCINCHFDTEVDEQQKIAGAQIFDWKFIMKWEKDGVSKYHPATVMSLKYDCSRPQTTPPYPDCADPDDPKKTFAVFAPFYGHTVTKKATDDIAAGGGCAYCHASFGDGAAKAICDTIALAGGANPKQKLIEWNGAMGNLSNPVSGLIPLPPDYQDRFEMDFAALAAGSGEPMNLEFFEVGPDLWQTGVDFPPSAAPLQELGRPLTTEEFAKFCNE